MTCKGSKKRLLIKTKAAKVCKNPIFIAKTAITAFETNRAYRILQSGTPCFNMKMIYVWKWRLSERESEAGGEVADVVSAFNVYSYGRTEIVAETRYAGKRDVSVELTVGDAFVTCI